MAQEFNTQGLFGIEDELDYLNERASQFFSPSTTAAVSSGSGVGPVGALATLMGRKVGNAFFGIEDEEKNPFEIDEGMLLGEPSEDADVNPMMLAGLGLGGGIVASKTGGMPSTSGKLSSFAQKVAAQDAARLASTNRPVLVGPNNSPTFTGVNQARPVPGTKIVPTGQLPVLGSTGGAPATTTTSGGVKPTTASSFDYKVNTSKGSSTVKPNRFVGGLSGLLKGAGVSALLTPNEMGRAEVFPPGTRVIYKNSEGDTIGLSPGEVPPEGYEFLRAAPLFTLLAEEAERRADREMVESRQGPALTNVFEEIIGAVNARGSDAQYTTEEVQRGNEFLPSVTASDEGTVENIQESRVQTAKDTQEFSADNMAAAEEVDERLGTNTADTLREIAYRPEAGNTESTLTPRATFTLPDGRIIQEDEFGQRREITAEQLRAFQQDMADLGQTQPKTTFGVDETRARLGGRTLNEYLNAPSGTPGVSGLRTDPQGRMIPSSGLASDSVFKDPNITRQNAYGEYEDQVELANQRQEDEIRRRAEQRAGTSGPRTYGGYTTAQLRGMVGGGDELRRAQMRAEAGLNPITGNREQTEEERAQRSQAREIDLELAQARLDDFKKEKPTAFEKAKKNVDAAVAAGILDESERRQSMLIALGLAPRDANGNVDFSDFMGGGSSFPVPSQGAVDKLKNNPSLKSDFDKKYGPGASDKILGK